MSDLLYKRLNYLVGFAAIGVLFGVAVIAAHLEIRDLDLWLHIGMGRFIVQNGYVPSQDILSCTITGSPWINHEWLFQVVTYLLYNNWGAEGLIRMQVVAVWLTMLLLLFLGYSRERQFITIFTLLLVLLVYQTRFTIRPDIFSLLFFVIYIYLLSLHIDKRWITFALVIVQVLWVNIHGFFFFGPLFVGLAIVAEWMRRHVKLPYEWNKTGNLTQDEYKRLTVIFVAVTAACLANPMTWQGALYPFTVMFQLPQESKVFFERIMELQRPIAWSTVFSLDRFPFYKLMIFLSFYSFICNRRKIDVGALLFWLVFLLFSLAALRNIVFFAFAAYLVIVTNSMTINFNRIIPLRFTHRHFQDITEAVIKFLLILWMVAYSVGRSSGSFFDYEKFESKSDMEGISLRNYPKGAADFLVAHNVKGNIFNDFNSGAYLVGRCSPNIKVFIDGRTEVYGPVFFDNYLKIIEQGDMALFDKVSDERNVTLALLSSVNDEIPKPLLKHLYQNKNWAAVYFDHDGLIFAKRVPEQEALIKEFEIDLAQWPEKNMDLFLLGVGRVSPYPFTHRAYTLQSLDLDGPARLEAQEALKIDPSSVEAYKILGKIAGREGDHQKAFESFRLAAMGDPSLAENRFNLAQAYYDLKEYKGAIMQYQAILNSEPKNQRAKFLLARAYALNQQYDKSWEAIQAAHKLSPNASVDLLALGDLFFEHKQYEGAQKIFEMALTVKNVNSDAYQRLGDVYQRLGDNKKALEVLRKYLEKNPDSPDVIKKVSELEAVQ